MPIYEYECQACGPFAALRPLADYRQAHACPACGAPAARAYVTAPAVGRAGSVNEPARRGGAYLASAAGAHPTGCGCCTRPLSLPRALAAGGRVFESHGPPRV